MSNPRLIKDTFREEGFDYQYSVLHSPGILMGSQMREPLSEIKDS